MLNLKLGNTAPLFRRVWSNKYSLDYNDIDFSMSNFEIEDKTMQQEITEYLREIIKSTLKISDFGLVERSHEDKEWKIILLIKKL